MTVEPRVTAYNPGWSAHPTKAILSVLLFAAILVTPKVFSADISGIWKHSTEPSWIQIDMDEGIGTVVRNDKFPEGVGRQILKDLMPNKFEPTLWHGMIYIQKLDDYKHVEVSLSEPDRMKITGKVGFISRTAEWVRVDKTPQGTPPVFQSLNRPEGSIR